MSYYAQIDDTDNVTRVAKVDRDFLDAHPHRYPGRWVRTYYDRPPARYAAVGWTYHPDTPWQFAPPAPGDGWTLDRDGVWQPPAD